MDSTFMYDSNDNLLDPADFELVAPKDLVVGNKYWRRLRGPNQANRPGVWYGPMFEVFLTNHYPKFKMYYYRYVNSRGEPDMEDDESSFANSGGYLMLFYRKVVHPAPARSRVVTLLHTED